MSREDKDEKSFTEISDELESLTQQMDDMMVIQISRMDAIFKKSFIHSILWSLAAVGTYYFWPKDWYWWVPTGFAVMTVASFIFVAIMRVKLLKKINET